MVQDEILARFLWHPQSKGTGGRIAQQAHLTQRLQRESYVDVQPTLHESKEQQLFTEYWPAGSTELPRAVGCL